MVGTDQKVFILHKTQKCQRLQDFPNETVSSAMANLAGQPVVCGGWNWQGQVTGPVASCYKFNGSKWTQFACMKERRQNPTAIEVKGKLWITGGYCDGQHLKTTELLNADGQVNAGPDLPEALSGHCIVKYADKIFIIGGINYFKGPFNPRGGPLNGTRIYNGNLSFLGSGPKLNFSRDCSSACIIKSDNHEGRPIIMVVGGITSPRSIEVWDFTKAGTKWEQAPNFPIDLSYKPGLFANPWGPGICIIHEQIIHTLILKNGHYKYKKMGQRSDFPNDLLASLML